MDLTRVLVVCGTGNNAGDGVALARILTERGYAVEIFAAGDPAKYSEQMKTQMEIIRHYPVPVLRGTFGTQGYTLLVDALFGIGMHRKIEGSYAEIIEKINGSGIPVAAVDLPSGIQTDSGAVCGTAVRADLTVTFTTGKAGLYLYPGAANAGRIFVKEIGIPVPEDVRDDCLWFEAGEEDLQLIPARPENAHKGTFGKVLVIAGSDEICGAAYLSAAAALRCGGGMVRIYTEEKNRTALATLLPEALLTVYSGKNWSKETLLRDLAWADAVLVGPGLGTSQTAVKIMETLLSGEWKKPTVMDADALNVLASREHLLCSIDFPLTITPHVAEMSRLCEYSVSEIKAEPVYVAQRTAEACGACVVLKDARTVTAFPDGRCFLNRSGCSALATAGSGDVLAGMITALTLLFTDLPVPAQVLAVYIHGKIGERAREKYSAAAVTAGNLLEFICEFL
jgi:NAD(P)H-hydrate epimerase